MKKSLFYISSILAAIFFLNSCTTDFKLAADYEETMIIYGILNQQEQIHYIRIHKAFLDEETSALVIAENPDSIYYPDILNVTVTEDLTKKVYTLERVNGDTLGLPKNEGVFASSPNILYRFKGNLNQNSTYSLRVENTQTGYVATSNTALVKDFIVRRPFVNQPINLVSETSNYETVWDLAENSRIVDLVVTLRYTIAEKSNPTKRIDTGYVIWEAFKGKPVSPSIPTKQELNGKNFYNRVQFVLDPLPDHIRYADSLYFTFYAGNEVLSNYITFNEIQGGFLQDNVTSQYTNIENGFGLFAARYYKTVPNVVLNNQSLDSLACGSITGDLGFAPSADILRYPNYPYCN